MDKPDDDDIYSDLTNFKYNEHLDKLHSAKRNLQAKIKELEEKVENLTKENNELRSSCDYLSRNMSSLLKTAKEEIKRKDSRISELNQELIQFKQRNLNLARKRHRDPLKDSDDVLKENIEVKKPKYDHFSRDDDRERRFRKSSSYNVEETKRHYRRTSSEIRSENDRERKSVERRRDFGTDHDRNESRNIEGETNHIKKESSLTTLLPNITNNDVSSLNSKCKEQSGEIQEEKQDSKAKTKPLLVPNINCPTLYSQRMFKKIYNVSPLKPGSEPGQTVSTPSERVSETPVSPAVEVHPNKCEVDSAAQNSYEPNNLGTTPLNGKAQRFSQLPEIQNNDNNTKINDTLTAEMKSLLTIHTEKITNVANVSTFCKDIHVNELKSIISNVSIFTSNLEKEKHSKSPPVVDLNEKTSFETASQLNVNESNLQSNVTTRQTRNSNTTADKNCSSKLGMKLANRPTKSAFCPISGQWSDAVKEAKPDEKSKVEEKPPERLSSTQDSSGTNNKSDIMEALFGSPLKWADNSTDDIRAVPKVNLPITAFEDSCSAQIENAKFKEINSNNNAPLFIKPIIEIPISKRETLDIKEKNLSLIVNEVGRIVQTPLSLGIDKPKELPSRPFEQIRKEVSNFSMLINNEVNTDACDVPLLSQSVCHVSSIFSPKRSGITSPKYNDSVLGQFDDTTQLISALARDHSKISPIHTPIKENKSDPVASPEIKTGTNSSPIKISESKSSPLIKQNSTICRSPFVKKPEKKAILLDEPINILCPRKYPRIPEQSKKSSAPKKISMSSSDKPSNKNENVTPSMDNTNIPKSSLPIEEKNNLLETSRPKVSAISEDVIKIARVVAHKVKENYRKHKSEDLKNRKTISKNNSKDHYKKESQDGLRRNRNENKTDLRKAHFRSDSPRRSRESERKGSFAKKEKSPIKIKKIERITPKTTFKRPLSSSAYNRPNCHFRHSSVERKILKDRLIPSRVRTTPVRVIMKQPDDPPSSKRDDSKSKEDISHSSIKKTYSSPETPDSSQPVTKHIVRSSKKIDWSATTTSVISTTSVEPTLPSSKTESKMKWFLQPIDFNTNCSPAHLKRVDVEQKPSQPSSDSVGTVKNPSTPDKAIIEKTPVKTPNIVIIPRRRPAKFGVSEISVLNCLKVKEK